ncbi:MAG: M16 family metallopeptidase [Elsteraceae bacterium]
MIRVVALALAFALSVSAAWAVDVKRVVSPGGIEAWLVQDHSVPLVSMDFAFRAGAARDPADKTGLSRLASAVIDEAAGPHPHLEFIERLQTLGVGLSFAAGLDTIGGTFRALTVNRDASVELLRLALIEPRFDPEDVERVRRQILSAIAREAEEPNAIAGRAWNRAAFVDHPYARGSRGTTASVTALSPADLKAWKAERLTRANLVVGVAGDITPEALGKLLDRAFGDLPKGENPTPLPIATPAAPGELMVAQRNIPQSVVLFGHQGMQQDDPDIFAAELVNYVLGGGGFTSRLTEELREKRGLVYGVRSGLSIYERAGLILGGFSIQNGKVVEGLDLLRKIWTEMAENGPTAEELANAKTYVNGSFPLRLDSTSAVAGYLLALQLDGRPIDYIDRRAGFFNAVTLEDAKRVARRLLDPKQLSIVVVGKPEGLTPTREPPPGG